MRNNEKIRHWLRLLIYIGVLLVGVAVAYATLRERMNTNRGRIVKVEEKAEDNQIAIVEMRTDLKYIVKGIDEIKEQLK